MADATIWWTIGAAIVVIYAIKLAGHLAAGRWKDQLAKLGPLTALITVSLLAGLTMVQTFAQGHSLRLDARAVALLVAAIALWRKAPFIVVVILAAATAAGLRALGWG